ncbi:hypothetical protein ACFQ60_03615 [Streptomyces zhihengii]
MGYGLLDTEERPKPRAVPTAEVTYEVTGEGPVEIAYLARSESGTATVVRDAELPWRTTVRVPLGQEPSVAITLGEKGGRAVCTLAVRGEHVQLATASGGYGRATCAGTLPRRRTDRRRGSLAGTPRSVSRDACPARDDGARTRRPFVGISRAWRRAMCEARTHATVQ